MATTIEELSRIRFIEIVDRDAVVPRLWLQREDAFDRWSLHQGGPELIVDDVDCVDLFSHEFLLHLKAQRLCQRVRIRQGVATVRPTSGTGEIVSEVCVHGTGDVLGRMLAQAPGCVVEFVAAVDDRIRRIVEV